MSKAINSQERQIPQGHDQIPKKQEEDDESGSYYMPILNIRTKDERKEIEVDSPLVNNTLPLPEQKLEMPAHLEKEPIKQSGIKLRERYKKKQEKQTIQDKQKTKLIKKPKGRPKKQVNKQEKKAKVRKRAPKKTQPIIKKQKLKKDLSGDEAKQSKQILLKDKKQVTQLPKPKQIQPSLSKYLIQAQKVQVNQNQNVGKLEQPIQKTKKQVPQSKNPRSSKHLQDSSSSDSDSDSDSTPPHRSLPSKSRSSKSKKIKLRLTHDQKLFIWKSRYARAQRRLKQLHMRCKKCPRHHFMRNLLFDADQNQARLACQRCSQLLVNVCMVYWQCATCKYISCGRCEGYDWMRCPYGHPLVRSEHFRGQKTCDVCLQRRYVGGVTCSCNFDMCGECVVRARRQGEGRGEMVSLDSSS